MEGDRRRFPRFPFVADVEISVIPTKTKLQARMSDLSLDGCYIDTLNPPPLRTPLRLRVQAGEKSFECSGKVRFCAAGLGIGVEFDKMPAPEWQKLAAIMEGLASERLGFAAKGTSYEEIIEGTLSLLESLTDVLLKKGVLKREEIVAALRARRNRPPLAEKP
jgi:hypothetical protein